MTQLNIVHNNLPQTVDAALSRCRMELERAAKEPANLALIRDLRIGLQALELIYRELHGESQRSKGKRSAMFTRYVIDEELQMAMSPELRDQIVQIENIYSRY